LLASREHLERDFEVHVLAFSRQGGPKSHVRSLMVFGNVMIYLTELADKLGIDPVEAAKSKVAINGIQDGAYPSIGATRCLETGAHYGEIRAGTRCFGGRSYGILHLDFREHSFRNCPKSLERTCGVALQAAEIPPFRLIAPSAYRPNSCLKRYSKYFSDGFSTHSGE